jgi:hypothetical protein
VIDPAGETAPMSRAALIAVVSVVAVSLVAAIALSVVGDAVGEWRSAGADSYSTSAIGHNALVRLLEKLDVPVVVSRNDSASRSRGGLLVIAEPVVTDAASRNRLAQLVDAAPRVLVVLPKWYGVVERGQPWIRAAQPLSLPEVDGVLRALELVDHRVVRPEGPAPALTLEDWRPVLDVPQLVASADLTSVIDGPDRTMWLGQIARNHTQLFVLSDPDLLNNQGLHHRDNGLVAVDIIQWLRGDGPVVIDETMHGYAHAPSLVGSLFRFPLVLATLQVLVCAALALWAAMVRFGPRTAVPPALAPGKDFLIRNTAALLHHGGHHGDALRRYLALTIAEVRHALHAPALAPAQMTAWLERVRVARGGQISLVELEHQVEAAVTPARVVQAANQVFRWRMEMTHGSADRS